MATEHELSLYRMEQAERCLKSAEILLENEDYKGAANRIIGKEEVNEQIKNAAFFINQTKNYLKSYTKE